MAALRMYEVRLIREYLDIINELNCRKRVENKLGDLQALGFVMGIVISKFCFDQNVMTIIKMVHLCFFKYNEVIVMVIVQFVFSVFLCCLISRLI